MGHSFGEASQYDVFDNPNNPRSEKGGSNG